MVVSLPYFSIAFSIFRVKLLESSLFSIKISSISSLVNCIFSNTFSNDFLVATVVDSKELGQNEIILGSKFAANVGEKVKYYGREFVVKEKIEKTGTGYDISGFISYESAKSIMEDKQYEDLYGNIDS